MEYFTINYLHRVNFEYNCFHQVTNGDGKNELRRKNL